MQKMINFYLRILVKLVAIWEMYQLPIVNYLSCISMVLFK